MKTVMVFGTFDVLHEGHKFLLREAKKLGDKLVVVIGRDSTVEKIKGKKPRNNQSMRMLCVYDEPAVDEAVLGYEDDYLKIIEEKRPDIMCLGYDQKAPTENLEKELEKRGLRPEIIRMKPYKEDVYKSSKFTG